MPHLFLLPEEMAYSRHPLHGHPCWSAHQSWPMSAQLVPHLSPGRAPCIPADHSSIPLLFTLETDCILNKSLNFVKFNLMALRKYFSCCLLDHIHLMSSATREWHTISVLILHHRCLPPDNIEKEDWNQYSVILHPCCWRDHVCTYQQFGPLGTNSEDYFILPMSLNNSECTKLSQQKSLAGDCSTSVGDHCSNNLHKTFCRKAMVLPCQNYDATEPPTEFSDLQ